MSNQDEDPAPDDDLSAELEVDQGGESAEMDSSEFDLAPDYVDETAMEDDGAPLPDMDVEGDAEDLDGDDPAPDAEEDEAGAEMEFAIDSEGDPSPVLA